MRHWAAIVCGTADRSAGSVAQSGQGGLGGVGPCARRAILLKPRRNADCGGRLLLEQWVVGEQGGTSTGLVPMQAGAYKYGLPPANLYRASGRLPFSVRSWVAAG